MNRGQIEKMALGHNPREIGMDCEEAITYLSRKLIEVEDSYTKLMTDVRDFSMNYVLPPDSALKFSPDWPGSDEKKLEGGE